MTINIGFRTNTLLFLGSLDQVHSLHSDQGYILNQLDLILQSQLELAYLYSSQISSYLLQNIEKGMFIIQTIKCMVGIHSLLRKEDKQRISFFLNREYKLEDNWKELKKLQKVNKMLIVDFLQVISSISEWFQMELEQKEFRQVQKKDCIKLIEVLYTISRCSFEDKCALKLKTEQPLLCIYRLFFENQLLFTQFIKQQQYVQKLYCALFYVSSSITLPFYNSNLQFGIEQQPILSQLKVVLFVIGEISGKLQSAYRGEKNQMLIKNYRLCSKNTQIDKDEVLLRLKTGISGLIASRVSLDKQFDLLWLIKILLELSSYNPSQQAGIIKEIKAKSVKLRILLERISH